MPTLKEAALNFLDLKTIAVAGVSSKQKDSANYIYLKLKETGHTVYPVNPNAEVVEGDTCYPDLASLPEKPEGVMVATHPDVTLSIVEECAKLGIGHVWFHRSVDNGSYSEAAEKFCIEHNINLIPSGCPMMYCAPVDFPHKCMKWVLQTFGKLPRKI